MLLSPQEKERYSQQIMLEQVGAEGQLKLKKARVLCVGAGGLGSSLLLHLAAAGVGTLGIVDDDLLELSNLQRQILYKESELGAPKALLAKQALLALNPRLSIQAYPERLQAENSAALFKDYDLVADCTDNFGTRYLINEQAYLLNKPSIYASIRHYQGQVALFLGRQTPCLRCLFPEPPPVGLFPPCTEGGVLGVLPGLLGTLQAAEILKWCLGLAGLLSGKLLCVDLLSLQFQTLSLVKDPTCSVCGAGRGRSAAHEDGVGMA